MSGKYYLIETPSSHTQVVAAAVEVTASGALVVLDEELGIVRAYAPGQWVRVEILS